MHGWTTRFHQAVLALMASTVPIVVGMQGWGGRWRLEPGAAGRRAGPRTVSPVTGRVHGDWTDPGWRHVLDVAAGVGTCRARDLILTNRAVSVAEVKAMGLSSRVVDDQDLRATVDSLAAELADGATGALAAARDLVLGGLARDFAEQLEEEATSIAVRADSVQGREGVRAFVERRAPHYHG